MNANILKRVVRAIADGSQEDLDRLAEKIVEGERRTGHGKLAAELQAILKKAKSQRRTSVLPGSYTRKAPADLERSLNDLPLSRRYGESLAVVVPTEQLEHHMVLPEEVEKRFVRIESEYAARDRLRIFGLKPRKTVLLYGPPGCGKSLGAKRIAWSIGLPLIKVRFDVLISSYFGESASNLRTIFAAANARPCVLLLDECDFIARSRSNSKDIGEASRIVNALLQLMEDYNAPGLLIATTNIEASLDHALFRRFDDVFMVPPPGPKEIEKLLRMSLSSVKLVDPAHWDQLIESLSGSSAAMVVKAAQDAAKAAVLSGSHAVTHQHLRQAIAEVQRKDSSSPNQ